MSYKLKFNHVNKSQTIFGLRKLTLHTNTASYDGTLMRERLTYSLFREMGIAAPRQVHVRASLVTGQGTCAKTQLLGLHLLTEAIDSRFVKTYFQGGNL